MDKIVQEAENYVRPLLEQLDERYCYHNLTHTLHVKRAAEQLSETAKLNEEGREIFLLAVLFHDTGFIEVYRGHEKASAGIARNFLEEKSYPPEKIEKVLTCIAVTEMNVEAKTKLELFMKDADLSNLGQPDYLTYLNQLRCEWEVVLGEQYTDQEWYKLNHQFLKNHHYYTPAAIALYSQQSKINQKLLKKMAKANKKLLKKGAQENQKRPNDV